jgi:hypothetical protein
MAEWEKTKDSNKAEDLKKKARWRRGVLYFGRVQSAHLFEAFGIIAEIKKDSDLSAVVAAVDRKTQNSFDTVANFLNDPDYKMLAKMRNVIAFHYDTKLTLKRLKRLADQSPSHLTNYSLGGETLDWYFELGDLIADEIVVREVFQIPDSADLEKAAIAVLNRLHIIGSGFTDFAGYFIGACCAK